MMIHKKHNGFTLLEMMLVLTIITIIIVPLTNFFLRATEDRRIDVVVGEFLDLIHSAQIFAAENLELWPDQANNCVNAVDVLSDPGQGYLAGFNETSVFNTVIETGCPVIGVGPRRFNITLDVVDEEIALRLANGNLPSTTVAGSVITTSAPLPSYIPALELLLPRSGEREMLGDLDMGGFSIINTEDVELNSQTLNGDPALMSEGIFFAGIVPANTNVVYDKPICTRTGATAIPIVVPAGNSPTDAAGNPVALPMGGQYAFAEDVGAGWRFRYRMAVYQNNTWNTNVNPDSSANFLAIYMKCA